MIFGPPVSQRPRLSVNESRLSSSPTGDTYDQAYRRLMEKLEVEAKQKEEEDRIYKLNLQLIKEQERQEYLQHRQLKQAHAEILRRQAEDNQKKRTIQRSFDLSPAYDLSKFPFNIPQELLTKTQKQQMLANELNLQLTSKQKRLADAKAFDHEFEACQVTMIKSQLEMARLNQINYKQKVREDLTKSWSDNQRAKSIMKYIEGDAKAKRNEEDESSSQSPRNLRSIQVDPMPNEPVDIKPASPEPSQSPIIKQRHNMTQRQLAQHLQEQIRQNEVASLKSQIESKIKSMKSQSPTSSLHLQLIEEASAMLIRAKIEGSKNQKNHGNSKRHTTRKLLTPIPQGNLRSISQFGRSVIGDK